MGSKLRAKIDEVVEALQDRCQSIAETQGGYPGVAMYVEKAIIVADFLDRDNGEIDVTVYSISEAIEKFAAAKRMAAEYKPVGKNHTLDLQGAMWECEL